MEEVSNETITLSLLGEVRLDVFASALGNLHSLIKELGKEVADSAEIDWNVEGLEPGSALASFRGNARKDEEQPRVREVARAYAASGLSLQNETLFPYSKTTEKAALNILKVLDGGVEEVIFETEETEAVINFRNGHRKREFVVPPVPSYGAIEGRIQTLSSRGRLRFSLYDAFGRRISCYLSEGNEDMMRDAWDKWVVVEGKIRRDADGRPISIRNVTEIKQRDAGPPKGYLEARGILRSELAGMGSRASSLTPEEAIRKLRDE